MTESEAHIFLGASGEQDDPEELYETQVFSLRQFFLTNTFVPGIVNARLRKMQRIEEAYCLLTGNDYDLTEEMEEGGTDHDFTNVILQTFDRFQALLMQKRLHISRSASIPELTAAVLQTSALYSDYRSQWPDIPQLSETEILLGKNPDDMELRTAIGEAAGKGIVHFAELPQIETPGLLLKESKRLFLLSKKETHGRSV